MFYFFFFPENEEVSESDKTRIRELGGKLIKQRDGAPSFFGIKCSNRNFAKEKYWGKNQFNSSFPAALACYMRSKGLNAVYISEQDKNTTGISEISFDEVFGTSLPNENLAFIFESAFAPYSELVTDSVEKIDLVIANAETMEHIRPLEIKLTALPDNTTAKLSNESDWGCEVVVRSPTIKYMVSSMAEAFKTDRQSLRDIFEPACMHIKDWNNTIEMCHYRKGIFDVFSSFLCNHRELQKPLLMQPIWKTQKKKPVLKDHCLDIFVWSDFALAQRVLDTVLYEPMDKMTISRPQRAILRAARFLYEFSLSGKVLQDKIFSEMQYSNQTDKEFALPGRVNNKYMRCDRLTKPAITKDEIKNIVLGGGQKWLSPERRFDAVLFFAKDLF